MLLSDVAPVTAGSVPGGTVRIVVSRSVASVPGCPDWRDTQEADLNGGTSSNYGCAVNSNLAAMVANPQDLVLGQPGAVSRAPTEATKAIKTRSEEHTSELQSLMRISYDVFCLKNKKTKRELQIK